MLSKDTVIQRADNAMLRTDLGEEMVMMDIENGNYLSLNKVGKLIWELVEQPTSVKALVDTLTKRFEITEAQCFDDCCSCITEMLQQKLLRTL